jgi:hypothetical protein
MRPNGDRLEQAKQSRERGPDNQGCDEDQGSKCAKALEAGHWTVISKEKARRVRAALTQAESGDCLRLLESLGAR